MSQSHVLGSCAGPGQDIPHAPQWLRWTHVSLVNACSAAWYQHEHTAKIFICQWQLLGQEHRPQSRRTALESFMAFLFVQFFSPSSSSSSHYDYLTPLSFVRLSQSFQIMTQIEWGKKGHWSQKYVPIVAQAKYLQTLRIKTLQGASCEDNDHAWVSTSRGKCEQPSATLLCYSSCPWQKSEPLLSLFFFSFSPYPVCIPPSSATRLSVYISALQNSCKKISTLGMTLEKEAGRDGWAHTNVGSDTNSVMSLDCKIVNKF